jgi:hypothetical protein
MSDFVVQSVQASRVAQICLHATFRHVDLYSNMFRCFKLQGV